jgi:hypothetical protein
MGIYDNFKTDPEAEVKGIVLDFGDYWVRIARAGGANTAFIKAFEAALKPVRRAMELGTLSEAKAQEIGFGTFADHIVLDWGGEGMVDENGNPLERTRENVIKLFYDLPDFFLEIKKHAEDRANFRRKAREEESKN